DVEEVSEEEEVQSVGANSEVSQSNKIAEDNEENEEEENLGSASDATSQDKAVAVEHDNGEEKEEGEEEEEEQPGPSKRRRIMLSSDEEDDMDKTPASPKSSTEVGVGQLMTNIFGEDSDDEKEADDQSQSQTAKSGAEDDDEDEPRYIRDEVDEDDRKVWDFDVMMREKKAERHRPRRRRRDGSIDIGGAYDDQIRMLIDAMKAAAKILTVLIGSYIDLKNSSWFFGFGFKNVLF
ncbi:unnamed protein product, partial [Gongylonema pulchrum]|uniref:SPT6_acidic domain-containing protein n=1 Tax=Gongylonema pulchrum TaxID=637853 RepID=A0A183EIQ5_9BILA